MTRLFTLTIFLGLVISGFLLGLGAVDTAHAQTDTQLDTSSILPELDEETLGVGFWILVLCLIVIKILGLLWAVVTGFFPFLG